MKGQDRLHLGHGHESKVARSLEARGWHVHPWGQGVLSDDVRQAFRDRDEGIDVLLWRWMPDMIAVRGIDIYLVEAKSETDARHESPNFSIEMRCLTAMLAMRPLGLQTIIVWNNGTCNWPDALRIIDVRLPVGKGRRVNTGGSGTPFALVRKDEQQPLDALFGQRLDVAS